MLTYAISVYGEPISQTEWQKEEWFDAESTLTFWKYTKTLTYTGSTVSIEFGWNGMNYAKINGADVGRIKVVDKYSEDPAKVLYFTNYARLFLNVKNNDKYIPTSVGYLLIYIALVSFTAVFTFRYIKRVIYIGFLTMIAPMVAMTYPLDKLKDRKSASLEYVV